MTNREMIEAACKRHDLKILEWATTEDGLTAKLGRFLVVHDEYEDDGLLVDDEGELVAEVVGAEEFNNRRVAFTFTADDFDGGLEVPDLDILEQVIAL